jgi:hypothetical protein
MHEANSARSAAAESGTARAYAIQLYWSAERIRPEDMNRFPLGGGVRTYCVEGFADEGVVYGLRIGIFRLKAEALGVLANVKRMAPSARVVPVCESELRAIRPLPAPRSKPPTGTAVRERVQVALVHHRPRRIGAERVEQLFQLLVAAALTAGWSMRDRQYIVAEEGVGYALGVVGGLLMLALFLYPVRKRINSSRLGSVKLWFRTHVVLGVAGPALILFHANFGTGSLNDNVALVSMLLVAGSGFFGRYVYSRIHLDLSGRRATLAELRGNVSESRKGHAAVDIVATLNDRLLSVEEEVLAPASSLLESAALPLKLAVKTRWAYLKLTRFAGRELRLQALLSPVVAAHRRRLQQAAAGHIRSRLCSARRVAEFSFFARLFSMWHVFHYPLFLVLLVAAVIHVVAAHFY